MTSIFVDWEPGDEAAAARIAASILPHREEFIAYLFDATARGVPDLVRDHDQRTLLYASIAENTVVFIASLQDGGDPSVAPAPPGALAFAKELARKDVSLSALLRAYRIGQARFTALCLDSASESEDIDDLTALRIVVGKLAAFIDHICEEVARAYEAERERWISSRSGLTQHLVRRLLDGTAEDVTEAQKALAYDLSGTHMAIDISVPPPGPGESDSLEQARQLIESISPHNSTISIPTGESCLCVWISFDQVPVGFVEQLRETVGSSVMPMQVVVGLPVPGTRGFQKTYQQASRLRSLAASAMPKPPKVLTYNDIAPIAMLADDIGDVKAFVAEVLGALAVDTVRSEELRETLRIYLRCHRSLAATAELMSLHRNTVRYRIHQIIEEFGHVIDRTDHYSLISALEICRWYGRGVLDSPGPANPE
ncbi:PucR family transcriptional regulator [Rhodococcus xishaensis]|nr:helix-turn-helix domain-containing protein [Rhodococcus xishaensis]